jgi:4-carboxymuconolactone decarboxylase
VSKTVSDGLVNEGDRLARGAAIRREVLGAGHTDPKGDESPFAAAFREFTIANCWGSVWVRDGLDRKQRSMLNLAMLAALARWHEYEVHVRGAITNGVTDDEMIEIVLQVGVYAGIPVAAEAMRRTESVVRAIRGALS